MVLQERRTVGVVLGPQVKAARIQDLMDKAECWEGHIRIAQEKGDSRQTRFGETRLRELKWQIGEDSRGLK